MRLLADSNIVAAAVLVLRGAGHDVVFIGDRAEDPGDNAIIEEAFASGRVLLTKDHDVGALVFRDKKGHAGVLLIDDLGSAQQEVELLTKILAEWDAVLLTGGFVRAGNWGSKRGAGGP